MGRADLIGNGKHHLIPTFQPLGDGGYTSTRNRLGGARGRTDVPTIVDWYMEGKIQIDPMITHVLPLEEINRAFDLMHAGESIRSVVVF